MAWYYYLLIAIGVIGFFFLLTKLTRPKFKKVKKYLQQKPAQEEKKIVSVEQKVVSSPVGLNLDAKYKTDEELYYENQADKKASYNEQSDIDFSKLKRKNQNTKSILEQIQELSPELKALIFDRGLARKDYEFMSKKD